MGVIARGSGSVVLHVAGSALARGDIVDLSTGLVGVVQKESVANGESHEVAVTGMFEVPKTTAANTWSAGARLAITSGTVAASATGKHRAYKATTAGETTALVIINSLGGEA